MRGLLVTPWFAAGAGFVIAAALALHSPSTVLTYRPNTEPCDGCQHAPSGRGSLATAAPGQQIRTVAPAKPRARAAASPRDTPAAAGPEVVFRVVWRKDGEFGAIVTIPAGYAAHGWSLRLDLPGTRITQVWGAQWQLAAGGHSGLASMATRQPEPQHSSPPAGFGQHGSGSQPGWDWGTAGGSRFLVVAQGSPITPVDCLLNETACHFG
jgi:hypothetical protein